MSHQARFLSLRCSGRGTPGHRTRCAGLAVGLIAGAGILMGGTQPARAELPSNEESVLRDRGTWIWRAEEHDGHARPVRASRPAAPVRRTSARTSPRAAGTKVASLGRQVDVTPAVTNWGGGAVAWKAPESCLNTALRSVIANVAANYGTVTVTSTCRNHAHNRRVGGARHSHHLTGDAADIRVRGNVRAAMSYMRSAVGGYKHYGGGLFHIDSGPRRSW